MSTNPVRQIILDTETTGLEVAEGHRIIEVGCVELRSRRASDNTFHRYLNPGRAIDRGAHEVHGLTDQFLADKPRFADVALELLNFIRGAELIIHNAAFDVEFLNQELAIAGITERIEQICTVVDTVQMARRMHPGQRVNLDALCQRYSVDNSRRDLHGALLDAQLLAEVYLAMTSGQDALAFGPAPGETVGETASVLEPLKRGVLLVVRATADEIAAHTERLAQMAKKCGKPLWLEEPAQAG
ncbi:MAG TPA: DNA polymerase III subunit epsilon [Nevskiaceae bacterium]|nr:DNA polymerase III subunit epsilon [Nevskiaceae bacterium]